MPIKKKDLAEIKNFSVFPIGNVMIDLFREETKKVEGVPEEIEMEHKEGYLYNAVLVLIHEDGEHGISFHLNLSTFSPEDAILYAVDAARSLCDITQIFDRVYVYESDGTRLDTAYSASVVIKEADDIAEEMYYASKNKRTLH